VLNDDSCAFKMKHPY